jgi:bifunctional DNA-binding transcriptional regulator/antitoxin component of YhaV-PrlF toxin-antitoxin module
MSRRPPTYLATVTVSRKYQITLPQPALDAIGATPGDKVSMAVKNGSLSVRRIGPSVVAQLAGSLAATRRRKR